MANTGRFLMALFLIAVVILFLSFALKPYSVTGQYRFYCGLCKEGSLVTSFEDHWVTFWFLRPGCKDVYTTQNQSVEYHLIQGTCVGGFEDK